MPHHWASLTVCKILFENLTCVSSILHFSPCELCIFLRVCSYILSILSSLCELHTVCIIYPCELYNIFSPCVLTFSRMSSIYYLPCVSSILCVFLLVNYMSILNNFSLCAYILSYELNILSSLCELHTLCISPCELHVYIK